MQRRFGEVIRERREASGLSQEAFAFQADVPRTYISLMERGLGNASLSVIVRLATVLETSLTTLMRDVESRR